MALRLLLPRELRIYEEAFVIGQFFEVCFKIKLKDLGIDDEVLDVLKTEPFVGVELEHLGDQNFNLLPVVIGYVFQFLAQHLVSRKVQVLIDDFSRLR